MPLLKKRVLFKSIYYIRTARVYGCSLCSLLPLCGYNDRCRILCIYHRHKVISLGLKIDPKYTFRYLPYYINLLDVI